MVTSGSLRVTAYQWEIRLKQFLSFWTVDSKQCCKVGQIMPNFSKFGKFLLHCRDLAGKFTLSITNAKAQDWRQMKKCLQVCNFSPNFGRYYAKKFNIIIWSNLLEISYRSQDTGLNQIHRTVLILAERFILVLPATFLFIAKIR